MANIEYQRLTRARSRSTIAVAVMSRTSLWLGPDHLLFVDSNGYTETYKRFYFRDIQSFIVERTTTATTVNRVLAAFFVLFLLAALLSHTTGWKIFFGLIAGLLGIFALINLLQGPACRCFLRTAVQTELLPPLNRVRRAQKVFARIRPLIVAAQGGELSPQIIADRLREQAQASAAAGLAVADNPGVPPRLDP